jgi:hypothetical protein
MYKVKIRQEKTSRILLSSQRDKLSRGLDADRGIGNIVHRYLASQRRMVFLLTTERVFQGCSGLFLNGSLPRHARCATLGIYNKRAFMCRAMIPAGYLLFCSLRFRASGGQVEIAVGGWSNADVIASNNFLHRLEVKEWRLDEALNPAFAHAWRTGHDQEPLAGTWCLCAHRGRQEDYGSHLHEPRAPNVSADCSPGQSAGERQ